MPSTSVGQITITCIRPHRDPQGFLGGVVVMRVSGKSYDLRAFLRAGNRALTETWTYPWFVE